MNTDCYYCGRSDNEGSVTTVDGYTIYYCHRHEAQAKSHLVPEVEEYDFHYTISGTVRAATEQEAWDQWTDLLTQPRFLEDGTEVTILTEGEL